MESLRSKKGFICDMDGVIYHGNQLLPGVKEFVEWLQKEEKQFLLFNDLKKSDLPRNVDIYGGVMDKKRFFQNDFKKRRLRRYADIFAYMAKKRFF